MLTFSLCKCLSPERVREEQYHFAIIRYFRLDWTSRRLNFILGFVFTNLRSPHWWITLPKYKAVAQKKNEKKKQKRQVTCQYLLFSLRILYFEINGSLLLCISFTIWGMNVLLLLFNIIVIQIVICCSVLDSHLKSVLCSGSCFPFTIPCTPFVSRIEIYLCIHITSLIYVTNMRNMKTSKWNCYQHNK